MIREGVALSPIEFVNDFRADQIEDACRHIAHAATLKLPELQFYQETKGKCIIVGGAPSAKDHLAKIKEFAADPASAVFALNYTHNWLLENGVIPRGCVLFEIDVDPTQVLEKPHKDTTYFVCSLCHPDTFSDLKEFSVTVWHAQCADGGQKSDAVKAHFGENSILVGGGATTFLRTLTIALILGFRDFELFGVDSSFPDDATSTHFDGYPADTKPDIDGFDVWARCDRTGDSKKFRTVGYLAQQAETFRQYCAAYHGSFRAHVHGDGLLRFIHDHDFPQFYR